MDYINYRARQFEKKGSISATDEDRPRKRPRFDKEGLRARQNTYEKENDTESADCSSDSSVTPTTSATALPRPRLKRGNAFKITFPEPPTNLMQETGSSQTSLPLPFERGASEYCIF